MTGLEVVDEGLKGHTSAPENGDSTHDFRGAMNDGSLPFGSVPHTLGIINRID